LESSKEALDEYYQVNYANKPAPSPSVAAPSSRQAFASPQKDFVARYRAQRVGIRDGLRDYYSVLREDFLLCDPVQWWVVRKAQFPNFFCLAHDLMTIPGVFFICPHILRSLYAFPWALLLQLSASFLVVATPSHFGAPTCYR
jgi:hypothetical protein